MCVPTIRNFSSEEEKKPKRDSLRDAVNRIQSDSKEGANTDSRTSTESSLNASADTVFRQLASAWDTFRAELDTAWQEIIRSGQSKDINKKIRPQQLLMEIRNTREVSKSWSLTKQKIFPPGNACNDAWLRHPLFRA
jgi:CHASE3 domain sensor protein